MSPIGQGAYGVVVAARVKHHNDLSEGEELKIDADPNANDPDDPNLIDESEMVAIKKIVL